MDNNIQGTQSTDAIPPVPTSTPEVTNPVQNKKLNTKAIVAIVLSSIVLLLIIGSLVVWAVLARQTKTQSDVTANSTDSRQNNRNPISNLNMSDIATINQRARDTERKTDINSLTNQLEAHYAKNGGYPTLEDVNSKTWRLANDFKTGGDDKALSDPLKPSNTALSAQVPTVATGGYTYKPSPAGCTSASDAKGELVNTTTYCSSFTLIALLENKSDQAKDPSSTSSQTFYIKKSVNDY